MIAELFELLVRTSAVATVAIALVALLRPVARRTAGSFAVIWLWLLVPAVMLASAVPKANVYSSLSQVTDSISQSVAALALHRVEHAAINSSDSAKTATLVVWLLGALSMLARGLREWLHFVRTMGSPMPGPDGYPRSANLATPVVAGLWRARLILPQGFERRFDSSERELILAHEQAHLRRHDTETGALAFFVFCLQWFNPLVYWARRAFSHDQEMACDLAAAGAGEPTRRARYAELLLRIQSAREQFPDAVGVNWMGRHPLTQRIAVLAIPAPGRMRRRIGFCAILVATAGASVLTWAAADRMPLPVASSAKIAVNVEWALDIAGPDAKSQNEISHHVVTTDIVVLAGKEFVLNVPDNAHPDYRLTCTVRRAQANHVEGLLYSCETLVHGKRLDPRDPGKQPALFGKPGEQVGLEVGRPDPADQRVKLLSAVKLTASLEPRQVRKAEAAQDRMKAELEQRGQRAPESNRTH